MPLFEALGNGEFYMEECILEALSLIGPKAKDFLIKALTNFPITKDNERAAIVLLNFKEDPELSKSFLKMLLEDKSHAFPTFSAYLSLGCFALNNEEDKKSFIKLFKSPSLSSELRQEMEHVVKKWGRD